MRPFRLLMLCCALLASTVACAATPAGDDHWVELAGRRYGVEIAADDLSRAQGLMFRQSLPPGRGMLFIHDHEEPLAYWMKNTLIALDILYFDSQLRLVSQQRDVQPCPPGTRCPSYPSHVPARYVLELNAGHAARLKLRDGMPLRLSPSLAPVVAGQR